MVRDQQLYTRTQIMKNTLIDEKNLTISNIEALDLSDLERSRALASLAKANALVDAFFAVRKLLKRDTKQAITRPRLKSQ